MVSGSEAVAPKRPPASRLHAGEDRQHRARRLPLLVYMFILSTLLPFHFSVGPLVIHSYRIALLIAFFPCFFLWLQGRAGKIRLPDVLLMGFAVWGSLALINAHGLEAAIQPSGVLLVETVGAYLLARVYVRTAADFARVVQLLLWVVIILFPFALIESLTSQKLILDFLRPFANVHAGNYGEARWGLTRAQVVFQHPIHFGVFCASLFGLVYYLDIARGRALLRRAFHLAAVVGGTFLSLSSGPLTALIAQAALMGWDFGTRRLPRRWSILGWLAVAAYVTVDLISNRDPVRVFITYAALSAHSAYARIHIWTWGSAEVLRNPFFGIGYGDWERAAWMSASVDMFWLATAMTFGLPAFLLLAGATLSIMRQLGRLKLVDEEARACRTGLLITLGGLIIAGTGVHYWNIIYPFFMFLLGSGMWLLQEGQPAGAETSSQPPHRQHAGARRPRGKLVSGPEKQ